VLIKAIFQSHQRALPMITEGWIGGAQGLTPKSTVTRAHSQKVYAVFAVQRRDQ